MSTDTVKDSKVEEVSCNGVYWCLDLDLDRTRIISETVSVLAVFVIGTCSWSETK